MRPWPLRRSVMAAMLLVCWPTAWPTSADPARDSLWATGLRVAYKENPLGIDCQTPRLTWEIRSDHRGTMQQAYEIQVYDSDAELRQRKLFWDSGRVVSGDSIGHAYAGPPLQSRRRYYWRVRVWDESGRVSDWAPQVHWETGLLSPSDWSAEWIEPDLPEDVTKSNPAPMLRREFTVRGAVGHARAYVTSHGLYQMELNGKKVGDQLFTPGWTSYKHRLQYQTYDVTSLLKEGSNAVGVILGSGWYRGELARPGHRNVYGERLALMLQVVVHYQDGREETFGTDRLWKAATGPILMSEIYDGETYDARLEKTGWSLAGLRDPDLAGVKVVSYPKDDLVAPAGPPVRRIQELKPTLLLGAAGGVIADMGQNMVGWVRLRVRGPAGTTVTLRHAEVLDSHGGLYTDNLRSAKQTVQYTLRGAGLETYEPHFTFQGFRYVAIEGYPGELQPEDVTGIVIHSDMAQTGEFETSSPTLNQLQHNILWGQKGNFLDIPTDCPQRNERLGWTGDAQVFCRTAAFNMDVAGFFTKWLKDLSLDQLETGVVPHVIPDALRGLDGRVQGGSAGWADAAVIIPWTLYLSYGDKELLEAQYDSMARWVEYERGRADDEGVWRGDRHFGDWLAYTSSGMAANDYPGATTSKDFIATAFYAHSADLMARVATVLGRKEDALRYSDLFARAKAGLLREFVTATGRVAENTQTAYALALQFDLLPEEMRQGAAKRLADGVRERGHLTTGFLGTPYLCPVLSRYGYTEEAYLLLNRKDYPSWLYPVTRGATTIWERWDGERPDGSFQTPSMNSFNHYAYGAIGDWMYRVVAGIETDPSEPGYRHTVIQPQPGGGLTWVKASLKMMYGRVASSWAVHEGALELAVEVPANVHATVHLPGARIAGVREGGRPLETGNGITSFHQDGEGALVEIGSGQYAFSYPYGGSDQASGPSLPN